MKTNSANSIAGSTAAAARALAEAVPAARHELADGAMRARGQLSAGVVEAREHLEEGRTRLTDALDSAVAATRSGDRFAAPLTSLTIVVGCPSSPKTAGMRRSDAAAVANPPRRDRPNCGEAERECGFCGERLRVCIAAVCGATPCACDPGVPS